MMSGKRREPALSIIGFILSVILVQGSIVDASLSGYTLPICTIQGSGNSSPYAGMEVSTVGVVYADLDDTSQRGFFIQKENCDYNPSTSDGIFIYLGERSDLVDLGDHVWVTGTAQEYYGMTEILVDAGQIRILSSGNPIPALQELHPPYDPEASRAYFESLESMYVGLSQATVVGPTDTRQRTWLIETDLGIERVFHDDPQGTGEVICVDDEGLFEITPPAMVGDLVQGLAGALDFRGGVFCVQLLTDPTLVPAFKVSIQVNSPLKLLSIFGVATFNLANLFDRVDDPLTEDGLPSQAAYNRQLQKLAIAIHDGLGEPALIGVQEAENINVLTDLLAQPELQNEYGILLQDGPDDRGLDLGLLFRTDRIQIVDYHVRQGCTSLVDGLGPDGNRNVEAPQNEFTCDSDGDTILDGNRLFSRPPMVVQFQVCSPYCIGSMPDGLSENSNPLMLIINHWKSKVEDDDGVQYTLPRRLEQAQFVGSLVDEIRSNFPSIPVIVIGDLNDYSNSSPLEVFTKLGFDNLFLRLEKGSRYTYIFQGISGVLDHILFIPQPEIIPLWVIPVPINADYPYVLNGVNGTLHRSSDHDPFLVTFGFFDKFVYLPLITVTP